MMMPQPQAAQSSDRTMPRASSGGGGASRAPLTAHSISLHNSHFTRRMQLQRQSKAVASAFTVWIGSIACGQNADPLRNWARNTSGKPTYWLLKQVSLLLTVSEDYSTYSWTYTSVARSTWAASPVLAVHQSALGCKYYCYVFAFSALFHMFSQIMIDSAPV